MTITYQEKQEIKKAVDAHIDRYGSANKAAHSLKHISPGTLHQIKHEIWDQVSDAMFRNVGSQLGISAKNWHIVHTANFRRINNLLKDAQQDSKVFGMIGPAGSGKTKALENYAYGHKQVYYILCNEYMDRKTFLLEIMRILGRKGNGMSISRLMDDMVHQLKTKERPLLVFDEADKLPDHVLIFFITLYNNLEDHCGIVLAATEHLEKRIERGIRLNKKGYEEIYSRLGKKYIEIAQPGVQDITDICVHNGITSQEHISLIVKDSEFDLRRVNRKAYAIKKQMQKNAEIVDQAWNLLNEALHTRKPLKAQDAMDMVNEPSFSWVGLEDRFNKWSKLLTTYNKENAPKEQEEEETVNAQ